MEPLSIIGAVAACAELVTLIAKVTSNIAQLKRQWSDGARSLQLLIAKLSTIRAALAQIKDWSDFNASTSPTGEEMRDNLGVAMEGCQVVMEALDQDVAGLLGDSVVSRFRQFFFDSAIREYEGQLDSQITALQLLITAAYCQSLSEQKSLLRQTAAREVFQRIRDDTSTVREQSTVRSARRLSRPAGPRPPDTETEPEVDTSSALPAIRPPLRIDSFPDAVSTIGFNFIPPENEDGSWQRSSSRSTRQRPTPFEMLPYSSPPSSARTPSPTTSDTTQQSSLFSLSKPRSSSGSLSADSGSKTSIRQQLSRLRLSNTSRGSSVTKEDRTLSPKSQLSIRFPGPLAATDIYLRSEGGKPPPKVIVAAQRGDHAEMASLIRRRADINQPHMETGRTPLAVACHCGHDPVVELLMAEGAKNSRDRLGLSPLHLAAANGHQQVIESLLYRDVDINARSNTGKTPLRVACEHGQLDTVRLLVKNRAMIDLRDESQKTPLHWASEAGDDDTAALLLQFGADKDAKDAQMRTPLHAACIFGRLRVAEMLINAKADIEAKEEENLTPLAAAARSGLTAAIELLLRHKASPRARSAGDFTPLHWASYYGHEETASLLIAHKKTEIDARSINGRTPLHIAAMTGSFGVIEKLIKAGASVEAVCEKLNRPLHYACRHATHSEVSLLLNCGANCDAENEHGETPIQIATRAGNAKVVKALVARGVPVDAFDKKGERPLAIACSSGHLEITNILLSRGASLAAFGRDAPVCLAASGGHVQVIQALLQRGAAVRETDAQGWEPLRRAAFAGHVEAVACLLGKGARATDLGPLESFSFSSTAATEQCARIRALLSAAVDSENAEFERVSYLTNTATTASSTMGSNTVSELPQTSRSEPPPSPSRPPPAIPVNVNGAARGPSSPPLDSNPVEPAPFGHKRDSSLPAPYYHPPPPVIQVWNPNGSEQQQPPPQQTMSTAGYPYYSPYPDDSVSAMSTRMDYSPSPYDSSYQPTSIHGPSPPDAGGSRYNPYNPSQRAAGGIRTYGSSGESYATMDNGTVAGRYEMAG